MITMTVGNLVWVLMAISTSIAGVYLFRSVMHVAQEWRGAREETRRRRAEELARSSKSFDAVLQLNVAQALARANTRARRVTRAQKKVGGVYGGT